MITGFGRLAWGMAKTEIYVRYPQARRTPPLTHERASVGGETLVPELDVLAGVTINATLGFDDVGGLACIELWPDVEPASGSRKIDRGLYLRCANALLRRFGLDAIMEMPKMHSWSLNGATVELSGSDEFRITLRRA